MEESLGLLKLTVSKRCNLWSNDKLEVKEKNVKFEDHCWGCNLDVKITWNMNEREGEGQDN